jgi:hypothetical protein
MKAILALTVVLLLLCACEPPEAQETNPADAAATQSDVMDQPLDGSSVEAFEAGLEKIREHAGEGRYQEVKAAVDYLLFYDLAARQDRATLYSRLDGLNPRQVIEQARSR